MFAVDYADRRTAYITVSPSGLEHGDQIVSAVARERQDKGEISKGRSGP